MSNHLPISGTPETHVLLYVHCNKVNFKKTQVSVEGSDSKGVSFNLANTNSFHYINLGRLLFLFR